MLTLYIKIMAYTPQLGIPAQKKFCVCVCVCVYIYNFTYNEKADVKMPC